MTFLDDDPLSLLMADDTDLAAGFEIDLVASVLADHRSHLVGVAVNLLGDRAAAEDAVQDAIERMLRARPVLDDERAIVGYARVAVVNCCRTALRRRRSMWRMVARHGASTTAPPADEALLRSEEHAAVLRQFDQLPARQREVLVLRHFAQLPDTEIATALSISTSTVRSNASRGIAALAVLLEGENR